jgi:hypothetical protein
MKTRYPRIGPQWQSKRYEGISPPVRTPALARRARPGRHRRHRSAFKRGADVHSSLSHCPHSRRPCKSLSREKTILLTRATEERAKRTSLEPPARTCAPRRWFLPSQNRTSIYCLGPRRAFTGRLSLCSLPVPKQSEGSLWSLISFAQSANCRTWQPARCVIL